MIKVVLSGGSTGMHWINGVTTPDEHRVLQTYNFELVYTLSRFSVPEVLHYFNALTSGVSPNPGTIFVTSVTQVG